MQLLIPIDQAISILKKRIQDLTAYDFNTKVWKGKTILDIKQIFGPLSDQWLQISAIHFDTLIESQKVQKLQEGKQAAEGLIKSYIEFIEQYSKIAAQRSQIKEQGFEDKYYGLLGEYNKQAEEYLSLMKKHGALLEEHGTLSNQLEESEFTNQTLLDNTIRLDNITLKRLWTVIQNLPTKQVLAITSVFIGLLFGAFAFGRFIERTSANNDLFDLKSETKEQKNSIQKLQNQIDSEKITIKFLSDSLNKIVSKKTVD